MEPRGLTDDTLRRVKSCRVDPRRFCPTGTAATLRGCADDRVEGRRNASEPARRGPLLIQSAARVHRRRERRFV